MVHLSQVIKTQVARKKGRKQFKAAAKMAADGCKLLLEHKQSDSATDLGQQMLELYAEAEIKEGEGSLGNFLSRQQYLLRFTTFSGRHTA